MSKKNKARPEVKEESAAAQASEVVLPGEVTHDVPFAGNIYALKGELEATMSGHREIDLAKEEAILLLGKVNDLCVFIYKALSEKKK